MFALKVIGVNLLLWIAVYGLSDGSYCGQGCDLVMLAAYITFNISLWLLLPGYLILRFFGAILKGSK